MGTALIWSIVSGWRDRQELQRMNAANAFLRKTLGEMTIALSAKDKEIDRLEQTACPPAAAVPARKGPASQ
jgi:hypothetical protein